jgi:hypothetical protein
MAKRPITLFNGFNFMKTLISINRLVFVLILVFSTQAFSKDGCNNHGDCKDGKGCYLGEVGEDEDKDDTNLVGFLFGWKKNGADCKWDKVCESGFCMEKCVEYDSDGNCKKTDQKCEDFHSCQFAPIGEKAPGDIKCEGHDVEGTKVYKDSAGVCAGGKLSYSVVIGDTVNVGSFDDKTCSLTIDQNSYTDFLNNLYSLAAFEFMFQNPTTVGDCLPTTHKIKTELAQPLQTLHKAVTKAFKENYFEGYLKPSEWLAKNGTEKDGNCGAVQTVMANLNSTHYMTNTVLMYGDAYKEIVYGKENSGNIPGIDGLPSGLKGYKTLLPKAVELSDEYFGYDWRERSNKYFEGRDNQKCRHHDMKRKKFRWWQRRYRLPDGLPDELMKYVNGNDDKKKLTSKDFAKLGAAGVLGGGVGGVIALVSMLQNRQFTFVDPILPKDVNFVDHCGGFLSGKHRRRCYMSHIDREVDRDNKMGFVPQFKDLVGKYYQDGMTSDSGKHLLYGILGDNPVVQEELGKMAFGNLFWYSGHSGKAQHPVTNRKVFFRIIENNLNSLSNYLTQMNILRKKAMDCFTEKAQKLQELCYDGSGSITATDYEKSKNGEEGDGSNGGKKGPSKNSKGITVGGGAGFIPNFTSMINKNGAATGALGDSSLGAGNVGKIDANFNNALNARKREHKEALDKMTPAEKAANDAFNGLVKGMTSLSPEALAAITGSSAGANGVMANSGSNSQAAKADLKTPSKPSVPLASINIPDIGSMASSSSRVAPSESEAEGPTNEEVDSMLAAAQTDKYKAEAGDELFQIISKAYVRGGYSRLLKKKVDIETTTSEKKAEDKKLDTMGDIE